MKLSVALCTYNGEEYLPEQLVSFATQTRQPDELVVCDDRSVDGTIRILTDFASVAPFSVRLFINSTNLGVTANFQNAIERCTGDVIALADQDDVWLPTKLERGVSALLADYSVGAAFSDGILVDEGLVPLRHTLWQAIGITRRDLLSLSGRHAYRLLLRRELVTGATLMFRSSYRKLILPISADAVRIHDGWIALLISMVARIAAIDQPLLLYRQHSGQHSGAPRMLTRFDRAIERLTRPNTFARELRDLELVCAKVSEYVGPITSCESLEYTRGLLQHISVRARLPKNPLSRIAAVARELNSSRYGIYSSGWRSAAKDVFVKQRGRVR